MGARHLKLWLLQFACKQKFHDIIKEFSPKLASGADAVTLQHDVAPVYVALCALHKIVVTQFDIVKFPAAVSIVGDIYDAVPNDLLSYKLFAKVMTGLKMLTLFEMLKHKDKMVLPRLNEYFPRTGIDHPKADKHISDKLSLAQLKFRKFFLSLIANRSQCEAYINGQYPEEYGEAFRDKVKEHVDMFIANVEKELPLTPIEQASIRNSKMAALVGIARADQSSELCMLLNNLRCPFTHNLLDILVQVEQLTEQDVRDLLYVLCADVESMPQAFTDPALHQTTDPLNQLLDITEKQQNEGGGGDAGISPEPIPENMNTPNEQGDPGSGSVRTEVPRAKIYKMKTLTPKHLRKGPTPSKDTSILKTATPREQTMVKASSAETTKQTSNSVKSPSPRKRQQATESDSEKSTPKSKNRREKALDKEQEVTETEKQSPPKGHEESNNDAPNSAKLQRVRTAPPRSPRSVRREVIEDESRVPSRKPSVGKDLKSAHTRIPDYDKTSSSDKPSPRVSRRGNELDGKPKRSPRMPRTDSGDKASASPRVRRKDTFPDFSPYTMKSGSRSPRSTSAVTSRVSSDPVQTSGRKSKDTGSRSSIVTKSAKRSPLLKDADDDILTADAMETESVFVDAQSPRSYQRRSSRSKGSPFGAGSPGVANQSKNSSPASFHSCSETPDSQRSDRSTRSRPPDATVSPKTRTQKSKECLLISSESDATETSQETSQETSLDTSLDTSQESSARATRRQASSHSRSRSGKKGSPRRALVRSPLKRLRHRQDSLSPSPASPRLSASSSTKQKSSAADVSEPSEIQGLSPRKRLRIGNDVSNKESLVGTRQDKSSDPKNPRSIVQGKKVLGPPVPNLHVHLRPSQTKLCLIKLYRKKKLDGLVPRGYKMFT